MAGVRAGQALVEFAVIALVLYLLLAAILTFGYLLFVAQGLQTAADVTARELSRTPLPAMVEDPDTGMVRNFLFDDALSHDAVRIRIYDEAYLVIDLEAFYESNPNGSVFMDIVPQLPLLNQQLVSMMIVDRPDLNGDGESDAWLLRYPGALLSRGEDLEIEPPGDKTYEDFVVTDLTIGIPLVVERDENEDGVETIRWIPIVEEIGDENPFSIASGQRGVVALRINYPFQAAAMSSFRYQRDEFDNPLLFEPTIGQPNLALDDAVKLVEDDDGNPTSEPPGTLLGTASEPGGIYSGPYGLGAQAAFGTEVRPYRRVLSAQAIYRREIFE